MEDNQEGNVLEKIRHGSTKWRERAPMASARQTPTRQPHSYQIFHHCIAMLHNSVLPRDSPLLQIQSCATTTSTCYKLVAYQACSLRMITMRLVTW